MARFKQEPKQLKVKIPLRQHLHLHALKVMTGRNMSEMVQEALEVYLKGALGDQGNLAKMMGARPRSSDDTDDEDDDA